MTHEKVDRFLENTRQWKEEMKLLREICLGCELEEDFKWMHPCYTFHAKNIVLIHGFKEYCALLFHKGAILRDEANILVQQTENVQSARQIRFSSLKDINELEPEIKAYIFEAIEVEKARLEVKKKKTSEYEMPEELQSAFDKEPGFKTVFDSLTPGRQRGYLLHFSKAKQSKTRKARIEKSKPKIFEGKGLNDK